MSSGSKGSNRGKIDTQSDIGKEGITITMKTDMELRKDVENELKWTPGLNSAAIGVSVKDGVVMLAGHVDSWIEKRSAENAAKRVSGVQAVAQEIEVRVPKASERSDEDIAQAAEKALAWRFWVPNERIKVIVDRGWITLEGQVDRYYQKESAENAVGHMRGIRGVTNQIIVKPELSPIEVKSEIEAALKRSAAIDAEQIKVTATGSKVILVGTVHSWDEREQAEMAAWSAPGVSEVVNHLKVWP